LTKVNFLETELEAVKSKNLYRSLRVIEGEQGPAVTIDGRQVILLCSNNYLGLSSHPKLKEAAKEAIDRYGCSASSSRLISGNMELHERLERKIASFKRTEASLIFNSGYQANTGIIPALTDKEDIIFSDELNHASIIDGCRISKAEVKVFPHKDMEFLGKLLGESCDFKQRLIVTDGVFSMDGDITPLPKIVELADRYSAMVMVDEAHATGVLGKGGRGTIEYFGLEGRVPIVMGTLGKALGSFGAYVAGSKMLREYLINKCRSFIFSTALPPPVLASSIAAIELVEEEPQLRENLWRNVSYLRKGLKDLGYSILGDTQIIPLIVGDEKLTMRMGELLLKEGVFVQGICPPTVPQGKSRLRITVTSSHTMEHLEKVLASFGKVGRELGII
jgi:glycine C-acetyltransferase/8-amino-7-oxononanoate synthase